jgi:hypothetical protein
MRRTTVGFAVLVFAFCAGLLSPAPAGAVSRCTVSFDVNLMSRPAGPPAVDCRGRRSGPRDGLRPDDVIPDIAIDLNV